MQCHRDATGFEIHLVLSSASVKRVHLVETRKNGLARRRGLYGTHIKGQEVYPSDWFRTDDLFQKDTEWALNRCSGDGTIAPLVPPEALRGVRALADTVQSAILCEHPKGCTGSLGRVVWRLIERAKRMNKIGRNEPCWCGSGKKYKCHWGQNPPSRFRTMGRTGCSRRERHSKVIVSPMRSVPGHIARPSYADSGRPKGARASSCVKNVDEIARMRRAGKVARTVLDTVLASVKPGMTTEALDIIAHEKAIELGGYPSPLNYHGFPKSLCTSVNEVICHGIPDDRVLQMGDIINCDVTVFIDGVHGDCSETGLVGKPDPISQTLVEVTYDCMMAGIAAVKPGARPNEIESNHGDCALAWLQWCEILLDTGLVRSSIRPSNRSLP